MQRPSLGPRLGLIARLIPPGRSLIDVGTDHGYIPVYYVQTGLASAVTASDINKGPLSRAMETARACRVDQRIDFILQDGIPWLSREKSQVILLAGMGGGTIAGILERAPWVYDYGSLLILQPMSKTATLRKWLLEAGYGITSERLVMENGTIYPALTAQAGAGVTQASPGQLLAGIYDLVAGEPLYRYYLHDFIRKTDAAAKGLARSARPESRERLSKLTALRKDLQKLKGRLEGAESL